MHLLYSFLVIAFVNLSLEVAINPLHPNIVLKGYTKESIKEKMWIQFDDEVYLSENNETSLIAYEGNDYSILSNTVRAVAFVCRAPYPILWTMDDAEPKLLSDIYTHTRVYFDDNSTNWDPIEFQSYLVLGNYASYTGQYTCQSANNKQNNASVYIFFPDANGKDKSIFVASKKKLTVGFNGKDTVVLPCRVSRKYASVTLLVKEDNSTDVTNKTSGDWISPSFVPEYDPKVGFIIDRNNTPQLPVSFKCGVKKKKEKIIVNVNDEYLKRQNKFVYRGNKAANASFKVTTLGDGIECCSNSSTSPEFRVATCESQPHCNMIKQAYLSMSRKKGRTGLVQLGRRYKYYPCISTDEDSYGNLFVLPFLMECVGDGVDLAGEYKPMFIPPANEQIKLVAVSASNGNIPGYSEETAVKVRIIKRVEKVSTYGYTSPSFKEIDPEVEIFQGDNYIFECCGLHAHHAVGRLKIIGWKNGSTTSLYGRDYNDDTYEWNPLYKDFCFTYKLSPYDEDIEMVTAVENMSYYECIIPHWNDTKPFVKRINMKVREYTEPILKLKNQAVQVINLTFVENQFGLLQLDCTIMQGDPAPVFNWTKDGYKVNRTDKFWSIVDDRRPDLPTTGSILLFMRAVKEIEGEYECFGDNGVGSVQMSFSVHIKPRSYLDYWVALFLFGGFFLLMVITAIRLSLQDKLLSGK